MNQTPFFWKMAWDFLMINCTQNSHTKIMEQESKLCKKKTTEIIPPNQSEIHKTVMETLEHRSYSRRQKSQTQIMHPSSLTDRQPRHRLWLKGRSYLLLLIVGRGGHRRCHRRPGGADGARHGPGVGWHGLEAGRYDPKGAREQSIPTFSPPHHQLHLSPPPSLTAGDTKLHQHRPQSTITNEN